MHKRIKELAEQTGINVIPRRPYIDEEPDGYLESDKDFLLNNYEVALKLLEGDALQKFAELIVRECLTIANKEHKMALEFNWDNDDTAQSIKDSIKQNFGVE